jgi:hypothetical protein
MISSESLNELSLSQWDKTIILCITTHGGILQEPPENIRLFTVPEGMTIKRASISTPGECNLLSSDDANDYIKLIYNNKNDLISNNDILQNETIENLVDIIKNANYEGPIQYAKDKVKELRQASKRMRLNTEHKDTLNTFSRYLNNLNKSFTIKIFDSGTELYNKMFTRFNEDKINNDWSIQIINIKGMPDLLSYLKLQTRRGESIITLGEIINFLKSKGVENIVIFDFSCSNLMDNERNELMDERAIRRYRRDIFNMNYGGKKNRKSKRLKKNLKNKRKTIKRKNKTIKNKKGGNVTEQIDLRQILITKPIINAIKEYDPDIYLGEFKISKGEQGFRLNRMEQMMESNFNELLESEPVELKIARTPDGKIIGTKIDGLMKKMYEIINGRHRITRAIIEGHKSIKAVMV